MLAAGPGSQQGSCPFSWKVKGWGRERELEGEEHLSPLPLIAWWPQKEQENSHCPDGVPSCLWVPCKPFKAGVRLSVRKPTKLSKLPCPTCSGKDIPQEQRCRSPCSPTKYVQWVMEVGRHDDKPHSYLSSSLDTKQRLADGIASGMTGCTSTGGTWRSTVTLQTSWSGLFWPCALDLCVNNRHQPCGGECYELKSMFLQEMLFSM